METRIRHSDIASRPFVVLLMAQKGEDLGARDHAPTLPDERQWPSKIMSLFVLWEYLPCFMFRPPSGALEDKIRFWWILGLRFSGLPHPCYLGSGFPSSCDAYGKLQRLRKQIMLCPQRLRLKVREQPTTLKGITQDKTWGPLFCVNLYRDSKKGCL